LGHLKNFLKAGLKASNEVGGITICFDGFINY